MRAIRATLDDTVVRPWHGSAFRLSDGAPTRGPASTDQPLRSGVSDGHVKIAIS
jgi:nitrite reductase/ring-hydroxylating ferredoxin subunit